jgi:hypothetical protein
MLVAAVGALTPAAARAIHAPAISPDNAKRLPVLSVPGAPRSLVFVVVPVPSEIAAASRIRFTVKLTSGLEVLGSLSGDVQRDSLGAPRPIFLSVRVPSDAGVGLVDVAEVEFAADNGVTLLVPVSIRVLAVQGVKLSGLPDLDGLAPGDRISLGYRVQNTGNVPEQFEIVLSIPSSWNGHADSLRTLFVPPYGTAELPVALRVPPFLGAGSYALEVRLRRTGSDTTTLAYMRTGLRVREAGVVREGLTFEPFVALTATGNGTGIGSGLTVSGPVAPGVRLRASMTPNAPVGGQEAFALAAVGAMRMPLQAMLDAQNWSLGFGNTVAGFSNLTGINASGQGVSGTLRHAGREYSAVVAAPLGGRGTSGRIIGASSWTESAMGRIGVSASLLEERQSFAIGTRQLTSIGTEWTSRSLGTASVSAGVALRDFGFGARLGGQLGVSHATERDQLDIRFMHAPGGSQGFALAQDQIEVNARRQLTPRVMVDAVGMVTKDANNVFSEVASRDYSVATRFQWTERTMVGARVNAQSLSATSGLVGFGGFGAEQRGVSLLAQTMVRDWRVSGETSLNAVTRRTDLFSGGTDEVSAGQSHLSVSAGRSLLELGSVSFGAGYSRTGAGVGVPGGITTAFARWGDFPIIARRQVWRLETETNLFKTSIDRARVGVRTGISTSWKNGLGLDASLERNPFVRDVRGRTGWIAGIKLSVTADVRVADRKEANGVVYRDRNANGRQDVGEPGVPGVELRFDNVRITTGRDGMYRLPSSLRGRLRVNPASLPSGVVAHPRLALDSLERRDIPLVPTGNRTVVLQLEADAEGRVPDVDLEKAEVWLRDADGFEWVSLGLGNGRFAFEHVPVGSYTLRLSFERLAEPVRADEVTIEILEGNATDVIVPVRGRAVRIITPPRGGRGGVGPRGGARQQR